MVDSLSELEKEFTYTLSNLHIGSDSAHFGQAEASKSTLPPPI